MVSHRNRCCSRLSFPFLFAGVFDGKSTRHEGIQSIHSLTYTEIMLAHFIQPKRHTRSVSRVSVEIFTNTQRVCGSDTNLHFPIALLAHDTRCRYRVLFLFPLQIVHVHVFYKLFWHSLFVILGWFFFPLTADASICESIYRVLYAANVKKLTPMRCDGICCACMALPLTNSCSPYSLTLMLDLWIYPVSKPNIIAPDTRLFGKYFIRGCWRIKIVQKLCSLHGCATMNFSIQRRTDDELPSEYRSFLG